MRICHSLLPLAYFEEVDLYLKTNFEYWGKSWVSLKEMIALSVEEVEGKKWTLLTNSYKLVTVW